MTNTETTTYASLHQLYENALAADNAYQDALVEVFDNYAGDERYRYVQSQPHLIALRAAFGRGGRPVS